MPHHIDNRLILSDILVVKFTAPEVKAKKPSFTKDTECFSGIKINRPDVWKAYEAMEADAKEHHIPMRVTGLRGNGPVKVFTVFVSPEITGTQIEMLKIIAQKCLTKLKEEHAGISAKL